MGCPHSRFELREEAAGGGLNHTEHRIEHRRPCIVRIGHVHARRARVVRPQQEDLALIVFRAGPGAQDALVRAVERDDQVVLGERRCAELLGAMQRSVEAAPAEGVEGALVGALADVPVAGSCASRDDARAEPALL